MCVRLVGSDGAAAVGARIVAEDDPALVRVLPEIALTRSYWAVWHESHHASRRVRAVIDFLDEAVRDARSCF